MAIESVNESVIARMKADLGTEINRVAGGSIEVKTVISLAGGGRVLFALPGVECASVTYEVRIRHAGLHKSKILRGRDVSTWTDEQWSKAQSTGQLSLNMCIDGWKTLVRTAVALAAEWVQHRHQLLEESENDWYSGSWPQRDRKEPPLESWIDWRLAKLKDELRVISAQLAASWDVNDPFRMKLHITHHGLETRRTTTGCDVFDMATRALLKGEEWDGLWDDREFTLPNLPRERGSCAIAALERDVLNALLHLGCSRSNAEAAVVRAVACLPATADFDTLFRRALDFVR